MAEQQLHGYINSEQIHYEVYIISLKSQQVLNLDERILYYLLENWNVYCCSLIVQKVLKVSLMNVFSPF